MKKITILPDAGQQNPFQYQLIGLLKQHNFQVNTAPSKRLFPILRAIHKYHPDILYFDWIQSFYLNRSWFVTLIRSILFLLEVFLVKYVYRIPIIHTLHNIQNHAGVWLNIEKKVTRFFLKKCSSIRVYSEITKKKIVELFNLDSQKIVIIQDVPFHQYYPNTITQQQARTYFNIPEAAFVYSFFGSIKPYKGLENLIKSFIQVSVSNDYLLIGGASNTPTYSQQLQLLIQEHPRIQFLPQFIEEDKVQYYMNAADVMVLPFRNVEHSGSVDLCMSFKKPIISLKTELLTNLLNHQCQLLFDRPEELGKSMLFAKTAELPSIGQENFHRADTTNYRELVNIFLPTGTDASMVSAC